MKQSAKVAASGLMAALGTVLMLFQGLIPIASIALPALAGCLLIPIVALCGVPWAFGAYGVTAVLVLLLAPDREAVLIYVLFFGYYPALYAVLGRLKNKLVRYALKLALFNSAAVGEALLALYLLRVPIESISFLGRFTPAVLLLLANIVFLLYDFALDGLIATYLRRLHPKLTKILQGR